MRRVIKVDGLYLQGAGFDGLGRIVFWWECRQTGAVRFSTRHLAHLAVAMVVYGCAEDDLYRKARVVRLTRRRSTCRSA